MQNIKLVILIFLSIILVGCVSISLGDKTYEISQKGFSITSENDDIQDETIQFNENNAENSVEDN